MSEAYRPHITPREREILDLLNVGLSRPQIAQRLGIKRGSASATIGRIAIKLGGGPRYEIVQRARALGFIQTPKDGGLQPPKRPKRVELTAREQSVLELMNRGLSNAAISERLCLAVRSVTTYVSRVEGKMGGGTRFDAVQTARLLGLVKPLKHVGPAAPRQFRTDVPSLTARERDTLELMNRGLTNAQIAKALRVTPKSANAYATHVSTAFNATSRYDAVCRARALGFVQTPADGGLQDVTLTPLQQRCLILAAQYFTNTQIARRLHRPSYSVGDAVQYVRKKLGAETATEAIERAVDRGLLKVAKPTAARNPIRPRDYDILEGLFAGLTYRETAALADMTPGNVNSRLAHMKSAMRVQTKDELLDEIERLHLYRPRHPRKPRVERTVLAARNDPAYGITALTPRKIEIIEALARNPNEPLQTVADKLGISVNTLGGHLAQIRHRTGARLSRNVPQEYKKLRATQRTR